MAQVRSDSTDRELLKRVVALCDTAAWREFFGQYNPRVRAWCSAYGLDSESVDEVCQRVWVELARRMPAYQYDPGGSFRGWLKRLCHHRAIDLYRERHNHPFQSLTDDDLMDQGEMADRRVHCGPDDDDRAAGRLRLLREAREIQEEVRRKVKPVRWEVFWRVVVEGEPISEAAASLQLKYGTAYAAAKHVAGLLRAEGRRRGGRLGRGELLLTLPSG